MHSAAAALLAPLPLSLSHWLQQALATVSDRPLLLGIVGLPGCGKSTWAQRLGAWARDQGLGWLAVSLDDFYLEPAERLARGFPRRGPPGTHDLERLNRFLGQVGSDVTASGERTVHSPIFDRDAERRLPDRVVTYPMEKPLRLCLIEGWFVGAHAPGYEGLAAALDRQVYLDMPEEAARDARLAREAALRATGKPAMSAPDVEAFWAEALAPGFARWVYPLRRGADVVITLDAQHVPTAVDIHPRTDDTRTGPAPQSAACSPDHQTTEQR